ncbi:MAG: glycosyltransferase [Aliidongia sp.]
MSSPAIRSTATSSSAQQPIGRSSPACPTACSSSNCRGRLIRARSARGSRSIESTSCSAAIPTPSRWISRSRARSSMSRTTSMISCRSCSSRPSWTIAAAPSVKCWPAPAPSARFRNSRAALAERAPAGRDIFLMSPALQREHIALAPMSLDPAETAMLPRTPFFYYPANLWPHKNHRRRAFTRDAITGYALVLTGHPEGWPEIATRCRDLDIRHLGYVSPRLCGRLFQDATALVFFSQFEGFGIPLLEAFHAGTPVLCSNVASLPEVVGDAALMADPTDVGAMAAAMRRIAMDAGLRPELGRPRSPAFCASIAGGTQRRISWRPASGSPTRAAAASGEKHAADHRLKGIGGRPPFPTPAADLRLLVRAPVRARCLLRPAVPGRGGWQR